MNKILHFIVFLYAFILAIPLLQAENGAVYTDKHTLNRLKGIQLFNHNARLYDPVSGRFISTDPITHSNLYAYANNNPITFIDPDGKESLTAMEEQLESPEARAAMQTAQTEALMTAGPTALGSLPYLSAIFDGYDILDTARGMYDGETSILWGTALIGAIILTPEVIEQLAKKSNAAIPLPQGLERVLDAVQPPLKNHYESIGNIMRTIMKEYPEVTGILLQHGEEISQGVLRNQDEILESVAKLTPKPGDTIFLAVCRIGSCNTLNKVAEQYLGVTFIGPRGILMAPTDGLPTVLDDIVSVPLGDPGSVSISHVVK